MGLETSQNENAYYLPIIFYLKKKKKLHKGQGGGGHKILMINKMVEIA